MRTPLVHAAERLAEEKTCTMAIIRTMDWEALDLYKKLGYEVEPARDGYKNDSTMYILKKELE